MAPELDPFHDVEIPPELEDSLRDHRKHLARLVTSLRLAGVSETHIEESVTVIIESYKDELIRAIKRVIESG